MGLLHEIQEAVVQDSTTLGPTLLKLRLLASRLGSEVLEDWVKHESEGYPDSYEVPPYRVVGVSYRASFSGAFGSGIKNAPIPPYLIRKYGGDRWIEREVRESIASVEELAKTSKDGKGTLGIDASDLILLLQGKVYPEYNCVEVRGILSAMALAGIQQGVRSRILELTIELERSIPAAAEVTFGPLEKDFHDASARIEGITQQIVYGDVTMISGGPNSSFNLSIGERDDNALIRYLVESGIPENDASELVGIMSSEDPADADEPLGDKAKQWLAANISKAVEGAWNVGLTVATKVITDGALRYYNLK